MKPRIIVGKRVWVEVGYESEKELLEGTVAGIDWIGGKCLIRRLDGKHFWTTVDRVHVV